MSLGSQLAPHLPFLRRHARALTGGQSRGDVMVRATLEAIVASPDTFPREVDPRVGLYKMFLATNAEAIAREFQSEDITDAGLRRIARLNSSERLALLLTAMEGFSTDDVAYLLNTEASKVDQLVKLALADIGRQTRANILIIEDSPIIAMELESLATDLGHTVTGVAVTRKEAVESVRNSPVDLILADIQLADDSSGIDAVRDIAMFSNAPVIFVTAFPERLLTGDNPQSVFLITKPYQSGTIKAAISQALFFSDHNNDSDAPVDIADIDVTGPKVIDKVSTNLDQSQAVHQLLKADLGSLPGPLDVDVVNGMLSRRQGAAPISLTSSANVEVLRKVHLSTAERLCEQLAGNNISSFRSRLDGIRRSLEIPFDEASGTALGVQARGLTSMIPAVRDYLLDEVAADLEAFAVDLSDLAWRFPLYREFLSTALSTESLTISQRDALVAASRVLEADADNAIATDLKQELSTLRIAAENSEDKVSDLALTRGLDNILRGAGRSLQKRFKGVTEQASKSFDEEAGKAIGGLISTLMVNGTLILLSSFLPGPFAWLGVLIAAGNIIRKT